MGISAITGINLGVPAFQQNFADGDLSSGVLTVTHNLNSQYVSVTVFDNNDLIIIPDDVDATGTTALTIDLTSFGTLTGTWRAIIVNTGANVNNIASDLNLSGQVAEDYAIFSGSSWQSKGGTEIRSSGRVTRDATTATGTQAVTGVGFLPSYVLFIVMVDGTIAMSIGVDDGTFSDSVEDQSAGVGTNIWVRAVSSIRLRTASGDEQTGNVLSFDSDGFTINWVKSGSPTGTIQVIFTAFR